jgi:hypothetical protein
VIIFWHVIISSKEFPDIETKMFGIFEFLLSSRFLMAALIPLFGKPREFISEESDGTLINLGLALPDRALSVMVPPTTNPKPKS